jgi:predicted flavoprotein YhiN
VATGEAVLTRAGLEGGAVYALSGPMREALAKGPATIRIDLRPDLSPVEVKRRLEQPRGKQSFSTAIHKQAGLAPVAVALLREADRDVPKRGPAELAALIKACPVTVTGLSGLERAISSAGGVDLGEVDNQFMLHAVPGVFAAGEMLDWDAPTGGYLLQASIATGRAAARGAVRWLATRGKAKD